LPELKWQTFMKMNYLRLLFVSNVKLPQYLKVVKPSYTTGCLVLHFTTFILTT
jgi:hypothetical protein